ncbi:MAG: IS982 family transposase [Anaerolineae bacterium]|nr:IS982 family transposase [Anaerolineae bacterium]
MTLLELFCDVDDFCRSFSHQHAPQLSSQVGKRVRQPGLSESEIMTIVIHFHQSGYRDFKDYYTKHVSVHLRSEFPQLVSYSRFVTLMQRVVLLLWAYAQACCGSCSGISFVDSTALRVCTNRRIQRHKVFAGLAARGQCSLGWFYGFKLHLVVNHYGEVLAFTLTPGNVDDRKPVPKLVKALFGKLFGDKGYLSQSLFDTLLEQGLQLITGIKANMKNRLMLMSDKLLLRKRFIIETINDQLKNQSQIEHSRHRSPVNFVVNVVAGLIAYMWQPTKPAINWSTHQAKALAFLQ